MQSALTGQLAWYVTGRFYASQTDQTLQDVGYFLHLQGIAGELFRGAPSEASAHFTFAAIPFVAKSLTNADIALSLDPVGDFSVFFNPEPSAANFSTPASFAQGQEIAVFRRAGVVMGATVGASSSNVFTARLLRSKPFEFNGIRYDLRDLLPHGVTQWGTASTQPVLPLPQNYSKVLAFVGSAIAVGAGNQ